MGAYIYDQVLRVFLSIIATGTEYAPVAHYLYFLVQAAPYLNFDKR